MSFNIEELIRECNIKTDKLYAKSGNLRTAAREKRLPDEYNEDFVKICMTTETFLKERMFNLKELLELYKNIKEGNAPQVSPPLTDDDIMNAYSSIFNEFERLEEGLKTFENYLLPRYIL